MSVLHQQVLLRTEGGLLSGLLARPQGAVHGTMIALHGAGMSAGYFDVAGYDRSLLDAAARRGLRLLAIDRPGYGRSRKLFPMGLEVVGQADVLAPVVRRVVSDTSGPLALYGHSFGGKVALALAARHPDLGVRRVEICGLGERYAVPDDVVALPDDRSALHRHWGPPRHYPSGTFVDAARHVTHPLPATERTETMRWAATLSEIGPGLRCPLHFTFAEHEGWWRCADADRVRLTARFPRAPVGYSLVASSGHNVSLSHAASLHHEAVLDRVLES